MRRGPEKWEESAENGFLERLALTSVHTDGRIASEGGVLFMAFDYQLVVIGGGPGGYTAAIRAAQLGLKTALVERRQVGGTCLNRGCIPTKTLLHTAALCREAASFAAAGIQGGLLTCDREKLYARKEQVVEQLRSGVEQLLKANGVALLEGNGSILAPHRVLIKSGEEEREITGENILIATGSRPAVPPIPGADLPGVLTSDSLLEAPPQGMESLVIIGGGVIGVEFATVFHSLGCRVTILEAAERLLPGMDREISQNLSMILKKRGVEIHTSAMVRELLPREGGGLSCRYEEKGGEHTAEGDYVLISTGRRAETDGLLAPGVELAVDRGRIVVDDCFAASLEGVWAIGDVTGGIQLAHNASAQGIAVAERLAGHAPSVDLSVVPSCVYTDPEIASVGLTAEEAAAKGIRAVTGKFIMSANGKSLIEGLDRGFIKIVMEEESHVILGAQLMCGRATDLVAELAAAVVNRLTREQLSAVIHPHPTFCEGVGEALEALVGQSIHTAPRRRP